MSISVSNCDVFRLLVLDPKLKYIQFIMTDYSEKQQIIMFQKLKLVNL